MTSREVADALEPLIDRLYIDRAISRDELQVLLAAQARLEGDAAVEARAPDTWPPSG